MLAKRLVDDMTEHWKPAEFKDTYHQDLMRRIHEKIKAGQTKEITKRTAEDGEEPRSAQIIDLAALLQAEPRQGRDAEANRADAAPIQDGTRQAGAARGAPHRRGSSRAAAKRKRA